jgi:hypothetical protein
MMHPEMRIRVQCIMQMKDLHSLKTIKRKGLISLKRVKAKVNITTILKVL